MKAAKAKLKWAVSWTTIYGEDCNNHETFFDTEEEAKKFYDELKPTENVIIDMYPVIVRYDEKGNILRIFR